MDDDCRNATPYVVYRMSKIIVLVMHWGNALHQHFIISKVCNRDSTTKFIYKKKTFSLSNKKLLKLFHSTLIQDLVELLTPFNYSYFFYV